MQIRSEAILDAERLLKEAEEICRSITYDIQSNCDHKDIGETTGHVHEFKYGRVCLNCGLFRISATFTAASPLGSSLVYKLTYDQFTKLKRGT